MQLQVVVRGLVSIVVDLFFTSIVDLIFSAFHAVRFYSTILRTNFSIST